MQLPSLARSFLGPDSTRTGILFLLLSTVVVVGGIYHVTIVRWLCDDIFITFRYIDQWFNGNGLVYNPGERVEGYTHPLWLVLLSGWRWLGFDMISGSMLFGIVAYGMLLLTLVYASWRLAGRASLAFPAAAAALALHHDMSVWATSGLETGLFALLLVLAVVLLVVPDMNDRSRLLATGSALVLASLTRPDGLLFLVVMGGVVLVRGVVLGSDKATIRKNLLYVALPSLVFLPYGLWKLAYYGTLLPNTYYAKSGGGFHFGQGFVYIGTYLAAYPSTVVFLMIIPAFVFAVRRAPTLKSLLRTIFTDKLLAVMFVAGTFVLMYSIGFVARVGGDFMFARFLIPVIPLLYLTGEAALRFVLRDRKAIALAGLIAFPLMVGTADAWSRDRLFTTTASGDRSLGDGTSGIIDEHWFWTRPFTDDGQNAITMLKGVGERLHTYFDGLTVRILIRGQASLAYYSKVSEVIENWGLTDAYIAHLEIEGRGRIGHEKAAPMEYIVARRVHFFFFKNFVPSDTSFYRIIHVDLPYGWRSAEMHFYDRDLMRELKQRFPDSIEFVDFEQYLDEYLSEAKGRSREEMERDFDKFKSYYFIHNFDPGREKSFLEVLKEKRDRR